MVLTLDILRERGNQTVEHEREGMPPVLVFDYEIVLDGRTLPDPVNYALLRIVAPEGDETDDSKRPFVVIDPRAGHGPGIGGFKIDSEIGIALRGGHPCYRCPSSPSPVPTDHRGGDARRGSVPAHRGRAPPAVRRQALRHRQLPWRLGADAARGERAGPGRPHPAGRFAAGLLVRPARAQPDALQRRAAGRFVGSSFAADRQRPFRRRLPVQNFEQLNPANALWEKLYNLYAKADTEGPRFLDFERWWGGHYQLNRDEIDWIVQNLFVGNRLTSGELRSPDGKSVIDLRNVRSPIVVFASWATTSRRRSRR